MENFAETDSVTINTGAAFNAVSGSAMFSGVRGEVVATTEKAVKIEALTRTGKVVSAWLPRKALKVLRSAPLHGSNQTHHTAQLVPWFKPTGWTATFLNICEDAAVLAA